MDWSFVWVEAACLWDNFPSVIFFSLRFCWRIVTPSAVCFCSVISDSRDSYSLAPSLRRWYRTGTGLLRKITAFVDLTPFTKCRRKSQVRSKPNHNYSRNDSLLPILEKKQKLQSFKLTFILVHVTLILTKVSSTCVERKQALSKYNTTQHLFLLGIHWCKPEIKIESM